MSRISITPAQRGSLVRARLGGGVGGGSQAGAPPSGEGLGRHDRRPSPTTPAARGQVAREVFPRRRWVEGRAMSPAVWGAGDRCRPEREAAPRRPQPLGQRMKCFATSVSDIEKDFTAGVVGLANDPKGVQLSPTAGSSAEWYPPLCAQVRRLAWTGQRGVPECCLSSPDGRKGSIPEAAMPKPGLLIGLFRQSSQQPS